MNKNKLKTYATQAREEFIKVVTERAALYGITAKKIASCEIKGDYAFISGKPFPKSIEKSRDDLVKKIEAKGFIQVMEEVAYTWFNRFAAIRFMEINGYLSHGYRVLSHPDGHSEPEILEKAQYLNGLNGLEKDEIIALKTTGNMDAELYRKLIIAQCNELHSAMPFLFEKVDDPTELLLPDNLLNTDSVIRQMVSEISEEDWAQVEIIGWLYQFYISDKKDALMKAKKAYKTEDIPAVTQLFTPNWIVKYLVQNSLGAKWLATYPSSGIKGKMEYYIEPTEQTDELKKQLKGITPDSLNPEELTVMDPACGSGHILVETYVLLKEIYLERGYRPKDIPALILKKNLYGLEIDDRAGQLAGFALMMKARQDDRQIFEKNIKPNVMVLKSASGRVKGRKESEDIFQLIDLFDDAPTLGSLIRVPEELILKLSSIKQELKNKKADLSSHDVFTGSQYYEDLLELVCQAEYLSKHYNCVVANPPYMGGKYMNSSLKEFVVQKYTLSKADLMTCFMERAQELNKEDGYWGMINLPSWMFLSSFSDFRSFLIRQAQIRSLLHLGRGIFGADFGTVAFIFHKPVDSLKELILEQAGYYYRLFEKGSIVRDPEEIANLFLEKKAEVYQIKQASFNTVPSVAIAYWMSNRILDVFKSAKPLSSFADAKQGLATGNNDYFLRFWHEVSMANVALEIGNREEAIKSKKKWFPYNKGGDFRKWYGNQIYIINWENDGKELFAARPKSVIRSPDKYFCPSASWSKVTIGAFSLRYFPKGFIFDVAGCSIFCNDEDRLLNFIGVMNSPIMTKIYSTLMPTVNYEVGQISKFPILDKKINNELIRSLVEMSKRDWDSFETSWEFETLPMLSNDLN